jgi:hypothetical protein
VTCLLVATVGAGTRHTDDGSGHELDCFACYWALAATAETIAPTGCGFIWVVAGPLDSNASLDPIEVPAPRFASRGPPTL